MLLGMIGECETTIILNAQNWELNAESWESQIGIINSFNKLNNFNDDSSKEQWDNNFFFDSTRIFFEFRHIEIGIIFQFGFEKINGDWKQTLFYVNNC